MSLQHSPQKVKAETHPTGADNYTRCAGCFNWFPFDEMVIDYTDDADPIGFAVCRRCDREDSYERYWRVMKNAESYTGGYIGMVHQ